MCVGIWNCSVNRANTDYVLCQYVILHNLRSAIQHYYHVKGPSKVGEPITNCHNSCQKKCIFSTWSNWRVQLFPAQVDTFPYITSGSVGIWNCSVNRANTDYVLCQYVILHNLRSAIQHYYHVKGLSKVGEPITNCHNIRLFEVFSLSRE